jgi:hypothetical protein
MPGYLRGKKRDKLTYVLVTDNAWYGFKTKDLSAIAGVTAQNLTNLGHVAGDVAFQANGKIRIIGASAPKPPRVTKKIANAAAAAQQSISTFCAYNKLTTAMGDGWNVAKQRRGVFLRPETSIKNSLTAIAQLSDGSLYCFPMNKADYQNYGTILGLKNPATEQSATERSKLVSGSSIPRPGKASIEVSGGGTFSSFYSTDAKDTAAQGGFAILTDEIVFANVPVAPQ